MGFFTKFETMIKYYLRDKTMSLNMHVTDEYVSAYQKRIKTKDSKP